MNHRLMMLQSCAGQSCRTPGVYDSRSVRPHGKPLRNDEGHVRLRNAGAPNPPPCFSHSGTSLTLGRCSAASAGGSAEGSCSKEEGRGRRGRSRVEEGGGAPRRASCSAFPAAAASFSGLLSLSVRGWRRDEVGMGGCHGDRRLLRVSAHRRASGGGGRGQEAVIQTLNVVFYQCLHGQSHRQILQNVCAVVPVIHGTVSHLKEPRKIRIQFLENLFVCFK